ncbi:conserved Plasmodium protein, unknown function [Plasmodium relictum]|uniref:Uncharacterized protein n=1 Tax=Plasmodium relictum TaxID=85471 RepID=A0A1J1H575_PLARL|nr:conserved Plasmodium protein, unknown function [Plasmodium relictum]CRG99841.1 conserved Plasmodium protein, unknown function [Plasmodium relictum]
MNDSEILVEKKKNSNKNFGSSYEICDDDKIQEFYKTEFIDSSNEEFLPNQSFLKNKEYSKYLKKKKENYENKLKMEKELLFQNEMLKNILNTSQKMKEMQKQLFNVDVHNFVPTLPPESRNSYSIQREYPLIYNKEKGCHESNNYNSSKNINHNNYECEINMATNEDIPNNYLAENKEKYSKSNLISHPPRIGEIKVNIDDIKKGLLTYYSHIYSLDQYDIEDRINILRYGEKNISDSINIKYSYLNKGISNNPPFIYYNSELNNPYSFSYQNMPPEYYYSYQSNENKKYLKDNMVKYEKNYYLEKTDHEKRNVSENNFDHQGQFSELLNSLKNKCEDAKFRIQHLSSKFNEKYENPDNRFWVHNLVPPHLRKPVLNDEDDIRKHLVTVYAQLFNEAMLNKKKIKALEKKLHILKLKSNIYKNQYKIETRNAL